MSRFDTPTSSTLPSAVPAHSVSGNGRDFHSTEHQLATVAIHGGVDPDPLTGAILTPIHQTTTFVQEAVGVDRGYTYSRTANPTVAALDRCLGALEGAPPAVSFATGMAAITALCLSLLRQGDHVVIGDVVYGGTVRLLDQVLAPFGVQSTAVDLTDPAALDDALRPETRLVLIESPANPTLKLTDIAAVAARSRAAGVPLAVDNTFGTPALQRPIDLGADVVVHSTTKFMEGHNATVGGALVTRDAALRERFDFLRNATGSTQSPFEAWLTLRGVKTLQTRMDAHSRNALAIARWLESHPAVDRVAYPWLPSFPQHALAQAQQSAGGGVIAFECVGGGQAARTVLGRLRLCRLAESLGAVETLVTHPASMTHADVPRDRRIATGITDGLIRLSVGLESVDDLIADLDAALAAPAANGGA